MGKKAKRKAAEKDALRIEAENILLQHGMLLASARYDPRITVLPPSPETAPWADIDAPDEVLDEVMEEHALFILKALREYAETPRS